MYYDFIQTHKKRFIAGAVLFIIYIIVWAVWTYVDHIGKVPVVVAVVPSNASVTISGQKLGDGTHWLPPARYNVKAEKSGFATINESIIVAAKKSQNVITLSLSPQSSDAKKWANDHQNDYSRNEQFGAIQANVDGRYFTSLNPIIAKLPYVDPYFTIGYTADSDHSVILTISTPSPRYRFYAVDQIRKLGYNPTDYKIVFKDFHNPLTPEGQQQ